MNQRFVLAHETARQRAIAAVQNAPEGMEVIVKPHKSTRSIQQNSLYWKWLDIIRLHIADSTGRFFSAEELAEWFKAKFLPARVVEIDGESISCRRTTTKMNTAEMADYLNMIDRYCVDSLGLYLPQPGMEDVA
jgi:hypothetical protein